MLAVIRGAGDLATGIALRLWHSGISVIMTDLPHPTAIRRTVAFSEAIFTDTWQVEDVTARHAHSVAEALQLLRQGQLPVLADPTLTCLAELRPSVLVDAIIAKENLGTTMEMAPLVIGVGPGFTAGTDCHAVVETMRGHNLGRVILHGSAVPNTNIPGLIGGFAGERVLRAPRDGCFRPLRQIGDHVEAGQTVAMVEDTPVNCTISGVLRGILPENTPVTAGMKAGDVDPRDEAAYCRTVSDKAAAIGGGVLEAILRLGAWEKKKSLTILVDADDVLENLSEEWVRMLNEQYDLSVDYQTKKDWDMTKAFPMLTREQVYAAEKDDTLYARLQPKEGGPEYLKRLMDEGHRVYIATNTPYEILKAKMTFLLQAYPYLTWEQFILTGSKQMLRADVLIDDGVHNLLGGDYKKLLFTAPHNRAFDAEANGMTRVENWAEVYAAIHAMTD